LLNNPQEKRVNHPNGEKTNPEQNKKKKQPVPKVKITYLLVCNYNSHNLFGWTLPQQKQDW